MPPLNPSTLGTISNVNVTLNLIVVPDPEQYEALGNLESERTQALNDITDRLPIPQASGDGSGAFWAPFSVPVIDGVTDSTVLVAQILTRLAAYADRRRTAGISSFGLILSDPAPKIDLYYYKNPFETWCRYGLELQMTDGAGRPQGRWIETADLLTGEQLSAEIRVGVQHEMIQVA